MMLLHGAVLQREEEWFRREAKSGRTANADEKGWKEIMGA
ncbi:hypothetical protein SAMN06297251_10445 [Fulvimarina manganoxydans]|uniref:Uncharacterized protein n=1 Tax=Fulvimarina manganoxydans TaxID=937218 RepID=A0A1W2A9L5_9HYPH|nr:hypothetical protein SAMN06297251_10445 [Fulvimarina manganoxydans]